MATLPVEATLANAQVSQLTAKIAIRTQLITLQDAMGLEPSDEFDIEEVTLPSKETFEPLAKYQALAIANRADYKSSTAQVNAAKAAEQAAKLNLMPQVSVTGTFNAPVMQTSSSIGSSPAG